MKKNVVVTASLAVVVVTATGLLLHWKQRNAKRRKQTQAILRKFARESATPVSKLWEIADDLVSQMQAPRSSSSSSSSLNMLVSYTASLPTGDEMGAHYGVNVRPLKLLLVTAKLGGKDQPNSHLNREVVPLPPHLTSGPSEELFDLIAAEVTKFVTTYGGAVNDLRDKQRKLGVTYTSTVNLRQQTSSGGGVNTFKWRSYLANNAMGKELVDGLNQALDKQGVNMRVFAMVDDTVGDIAGGRYYNKETVASINLGMGTNASYVASARDYPDWNGNPPESGELIIDMDWGSFNSSKLPISEFDKDLDAESSNPGGRKFEKLISGAYLCEVVRKVLLKMARETGLFGDRVPPKLSVPFLLKPMDMAAMHQDTSEGREMIDEKLNDIFHIENSSPMAREVVQEVCDIVAERGARLAGAGIVGIVKKLGRINNKKSLVTVQGGLYEHYRVYRNYLHSSVWQMLGNDLADNLLIEPSHGGSGVGSIFLASAQSRART